MPGIFNSAIFNNAIFNTGAVKTGTGGIDPGEVRRIVKPTGILHLPKKEARKGIPERIDESREIKAEIAAKLAREFGEDISDIQELPLLSTLSLAQTEAEIAVLLRRKLRTEEDEILLLLLIVAAAA